MPVIVDVWREQGGPAALLVGCVSQKEERALPAKGLYRSELFRRRRLYAEARGCPFLIVSALHGLVDPDEIVAPYDLAIADLSSLERRALGERVARQLEERFGRRADAASRCTQVRSTSRCCVAPWRREVSN